MLVPNREQALQQIVALKKEVSELRAKLASQEEDCHKSEGEMHAEVTDVTVVRREQASASLAETDLEKGAHQQTKEALDLSEKTVREIAYLRASMSRLRDDLDQQRRLNVCLKERKKTAPNRAAVMAERDTKRQTHSCYMDEHTRYKVLNDKYTI
ncbi:unnamed protein product [Porites lobata]|uniref:Uncharacterized protein n=1 Tax=Porites lobata TaxID=104759 RepID=A0ABN8S5I6_9CNID|nr:unnamed protein product [Porites lobata]